MDPLCSRMVRAALCWLVAGALVGGLMLLDGTLPGALVAWLAPSHAHMLFVGWFLQFVIGVVATQAHLARSFLGDEPRDEINIFTRGRAEDAGDIQLGRGIEGEEEGIWSGVEGENVVGSDLDIAADRRMNMGAGRV